MDAKNINWSQRAITYERQKTGEVAHLRIGERLTTLLRQLPTEGFLFPKLARANSSARAAEFRRRCRLLGIDINLDGDNRGNQYAPLLVSSKVPALGAAPTRQRGRRRMALQGRAGFDERGRKLRGLGTGKREFCDLSAVESEALVPKRCPHASTLSSLVIAAFWKADLPKPKARNRAVQHAEKTVRISVCGLSLQLDDRRRLFENPSVRIEHEIVVRRDLGEGDRTRFAIALVEEHRELKPMQSALQL